MRGTGSSEGGAVHQEVREWVQHVADLIPSPRRVMDQGGNNVNGGISDIFPQAREWISVDVVAGVGVTVVADCAVYRRDADCDLVVSTELMEHTWKGREIVASAYASLRPGGDYIVTCAAPGRAVHGAWGDPELQPGEYYRNVDAPMLRSWLQEAGFTEIVIDRRTDPYPNDLRAWARKPGGPARSQPIAVVVPVLHRPKNAIRFMESVQTPSVYAVCDADDIATTEAWRQAGAHVITGAEEHTFAEKVNLAYRNTTEDWLLLVGDDVRFWMGWQQEVLRHASETGAHVIGTNDLMAPGVERYVHPVIAREYIKSRGAGWDGPGTISHIGYHHWCVDDEIYLKALQDNVWTYASTAVIEHRHHLNGGSEIDSTYIYGASRASDDSDLFAIRKKSNYGDS